MSEDRRVVRVAVEKVDIAADRFYDYYAVGDDLVGRRVLIPFGSRDRLRKGFIVGYSPEREGLKTVAEIFDEKASLSDADLHLAAWMKKMYFCTFFEAADALMPPGIWAGEKEYFSPSLPYAEALEKVSSSKVKKTLLQIVYDYGQEISLNRIKTLSERKDCARYLAEMVNDGVLSSVKKISSGIKDSYIPWVRLIMPPDEAEKVASKGAGGEKRAFCVRKLAESGELPLKELCYQTGASPSVIKTLTSRGVFSVVMRESYLDPADEDPEKKQITLSSEQQAACDGLCALLDGYNTALLHGVTGSGKTAVYIKVLQKVLSLGRNAVLLVPEISLTPQMIRNLYGFFGSDIAVIHSGLSPLERYEQYKRIKNGLARLVVGTRTAVLSPLEDIGVIIVDEEHDSSYRSDSPPRYDAIEIAKYRAKKSGALLILGSATPRVSDVFMAKSGNYKYFSLTERFYDAPLPEIIVADMRNDFKSGSSWAFGRILEDEIRSNLEKGEQTILFLNRRGNSRMIVCTECGYIPQCVNCSSPLIYHSKNQRLMCHHCGYSVPAFYKCPECGAEMKPVGIGTQRVEQQLKAIDPGIRVLRMDADTTSGRTSHEKLLDEFAAGKADVLLGTQMITKGLDFPNVTLVGILDANMSLYYGDYYSRERTFALLIQVAGRAGRREKRGRAVIQTVSPNDPVIMAAAHQSYEEFYENEIVARQAIIAPPFCDTVLFVLQGEKEEQVLKTAVRLRKTIEREGGATVFGEVMGPAPMPVLKLAGKYRYTVSFRTKTLAEARPLTERLLMAVAKNAQSGVSAWAEADPYIL